MGNEIQRDEFGEPKKQVYIRVQNALEVTDADIFRAHDILTRDGPGNGLQPFSMFLMLFANATREGSPPRRPRPVQRGIIYFVIDKIITCLERAKGK